MSPAALAPILGVILAATISAGEELRFIDGVPLGGPPLVASAMDWVVTHAGGDRNASTFAPGPGRRLEYLVNLVGSGRQASWLDRVVLVKSGRLDAACLILSDGDAARRAGTVEVWFAESNKAWGGAAFSLGVDATSKGLVERARNDLDPRRLQELGRIDACTSRISPRPLDRSDGGAGVHWSPDAWSAYIDAGPPAQIVAAQLRSQRLFERLVGSLAKAKGGWASAVVSGFPGTPEDRPMGFVARRWQVAAGDRLLLVQAYLGDAAPVNALAVAQLAIQDGRALRSLQRWSWNGADWIPEVVSESSGPEHVVKQTP